MEFTEENHSCFFLFKNNLIYSYKNKCDFFFEIHWHDLGFLGKILIFLGFLGKNNCQDLGKKSKKSKILAKNEKNPRSWQVIQDYSRLSKILARKPRRQALGCQRHSFDKKQLQSHVDPRFIPQ